MPQAFHPFWYNVHVKMRQLKITIVQNGDRFVGFHQSSMIISIQT
jgi:hypothetical protein